MQSQATSKNALGGLAKLGVIRHPGGTRKFTVTPNCHFAFRPSAAFARVTLIRLSPLMVRSELLKMLVCPENQSQLALASDELLSRLNQAIAARSLKNRAGMVLEKNLNGGLVRADNSVVYPIVDDIPMMLVDEAIPLDQSSLAG